MRSAARAARRDARSACGAVSINTRSMRTCGVWPPPRRTTPAEREADAGPRYRDVYGVPSPAPPGRGPARGGPAGEAGPPLRRGLQDRQETASQGSGPGRPVTAKKALAAQESPLSDVDPLDLVERDLLLQAVVELRGRCRLVSRDACGHLKLPAVAKVLRDPGASKLCGEILSGSPACRARRFTMRIAAWRVIRAPERARGFRLAPQARNRGPAISSPIPAAST